jgi:hypothetical protein
VALPGNVDLITVTGRFQFYTGAACGGTVTFRPSGDPWLKDATADTTLVPGTIACTLNSSGELVGPVGAQGAGSVGVVLPATNDPDLAPSGFVYDVVVTIAGLAPMSYSISLPTGTTPIDLADLSPVTPVEGGGVVVVQSVNGQFPNGSGAVTLTPAHVGALTQAAGDGRYIMVGWNPQKAPVALADAATILTDASLSSLFRVTLAGNRILGNPSNPFDGQRIQWEITQDATGGRTLTLGDKFRLGDDISAVTLSAGASVMDILGAQYHAGADVWRVIALAKGY